MSLSGVRSFRTEYMPYLWLLLYLHLHLHLLLHVVLVLKLLVAVRAGGRLRGAVMEDGAASPPAIGSRAGYILPPLLRLVADHGGGGGHGLRRRLEALLRGGAPRVRHEVVAVVGGGAERVEDVGCV
eukprot:9475935-Pyramimonas_sp.AAC.1